MLRWDATRPSVLVVACSDGRLQEATDDFLARELQIHQYDRFYVPGGPGALATSGYEYMRSGNLQSECRYLIHMHGVKQVVGIFHGPSEYGPMEAACADYRRKFAVASIAELRAMQEEDARRLITDRWQWAENAHVLLYRCEIDEIDTISFVLLADSNDDPLKNPAISS